MPIFGADTHDDFSPPPPGSARLSSRDPGNKAMLRVALNATANRRKALKDTTMSLAVGARRQEEL